MLQDTWSPTQYEKFKEERSQPFYDLMNLLENPSRRVEVVDLGCGTGELTAELHHYIGADHTLGLDSSDQMLSKAQVFTEKNLRFVKGDIQTWVPPQQYDIIFSNAALHWCTNHTELFSRFKRALHASGQLAIQMPMNFDYPTHVIAAQMSQEDSWKNLLSKPYDTQKTMLSLDEYASMLFKLGFRHQKVFLRVYGHELDSREEVIEWVKGTTLTHFQKQLSAAKFEEFLGEYKQRLMAKLPNDRPFFYPFKRLFIWGRL